MHRCMQIRNSLRKQRALLFYGWGLLFLQVLCSSYPASLLHTPLHWRHWLLTLEKVKCLEEKSNNQSGGFLWKKVIPIHSWWVLLLSHREIPLHARIIPSSLIHNPVDVYGNLSTPFLKGEDQHMCLNNAFLSLFLKCRISNHMWLHWNLARAPCWCSYMPLLMRAPSGAVIWDSICHKIVLSVTLVIGDHVTRETHWTERWHLLEWMSHCPQW